MNRENTSNTQIIANDRCVEDDVDNVEDADGGTTLDGGWGWVVVCSSFLTQVITGGTSYTFGVFYGPFVGHFGVGHGQTAWIGSLVFGVTWGSGPIVSVLINKFGCRAVAMSGALVAAGGYILSIFAPSIWFMYFSFGIVNGFGLGLIYLPAMAVIPLYFNKRRSFATGLAVSGAGFGTFIFAPLSQNLLETYGWKGAILIQAGLFLNCAVLASVYRPLTAYKIPPMTKKVQLEGLEKGACQRLSFVDSPIAKIESPIASSAQSLPRVSKTDVTNVCPVDGSVGGLQMEPANLDKTHKDVLSSCKGDSLANDVTGLESAADNLAPGRTSLYDYNDDLSNLGESPSVKKPNQDRRTKKFRNWCSCLDVSVSLLRNPVFVIFVISNFFACVGYGVPYIYLPDRSQQLGISGKDAAFLISVMGISNIFARLALGWVSDLKCVNRLMLYNVSLTLCGLATVLSVAANSYPLLILFSIVFGVLIGAYVFLGAVVTMDLLGRGKFSGAYGTLMFFQGIGVTVGGPIAGWVYDVTGDYDATFYLTGVVISISGLVMFIIPCIRRWRRHDPPEDEEIKLGVDNPQQPPTTGCET